jgi:hypothetical protein
MRAWKERSALAQGSLAVGITERMGYPLDTERNPCFEQNQKEEEEDLRLISLCHHGMLTDQSSGRTLSC